MRKYLAMLDNGHDKKEMVKKWGYKAAQGYKITSTELYPYF